MEKKEYSFVTNLREAAPRSKRKQGAGAGGSGGTAINISVTNTGANSDCDGHSHDNKPVLDAQSMDDAGYLYLRHKADGSEESVTEKVKAGYADEASHATEADNAEKWEGRRFDDYIDQPVRKEDIVEHAEVITDTLCSAGQFTDGLLGGGYRLWKDETGQTHLTIDTLTVRQTMVVLELLIEKIRSVGGQIVVSAANGKVKSVETEDENYRIRFEQAHGFMAHDLIRCQVYSNGKSRGYWVEVAEADSESVIIPIAAFAETPPEAGDECVLMGNTSDKQRQNLILISATEDGQPRIDVMNGVSRTSFEGCLRARLGNLDGIHDDTFGEEQPSGDGLFGDNVWLRGKFVMRNGEDVQTRFEITDGKIKSAVAGLRDDFVEGRGYLDNPSFSEGLAKWSTENETVFFIAGNRWIWANNKVLSKKGDGASVTTDMGRTVVRIRNKYIEQKNGNLRVRPTFSENGNGEKEAQPVYLSFFYRCAKSGTLRVRFEGVDKSGFANFNSMEIEEAISETEGYMQYTCNGLWNGTGDFRLEFDGDIYLYMLVLSTDKIESLKHEYRTLFEQSEKIVKIAAGNFDADGNVLGGSSIETTAERISLKTKQDMTDGLAATGIDIEEKKITLTADKVAVKNNAGETTMLLDSDGKLTADLLRASRALMAGDEGGLRVEITADNKSVEIYDANGELCTVFEGNTFDDINAIFGDSEGDITITNGSGGVSLDNYTDHPLSWEVGSETISGVFHTDTPAVIDFGGTLNTRVVSDVNPKEPGNAQARLQLWAETSDTEDFGKITHKVLVAESGCFIMGQDESGEVVYDSYQAALNGIRAKVAAGYHRLVVEYQLTAYNYTPSLCTDWAYANWNGITASYKTEFYISRYFANGFVIGSRRDNYVLAHNGESGISFAVENGNSGFRVSPATGVQVKGADGTWKTLS